MNKMKVICTRCGHIDKPITVTPGDCLTELVLWQRKGLILHW